MENSKTTNGILYTEELAGSGGMAFTLFPTITDTSVMISEAKRELRNTRDAVHIRLATSEDWDELFRTEIFSHPATKALRWYEINAPLDKIREQRLKGLTPAEYVEQFALPLTSETKSANIERLGEAILKQ